MSTTPSSLSASATRESKFSEITTMTVMSRLKSTNEYNKVLQTRHNQILFKVEKFWSECDADGREALNDLLLDTCEIQRRDKQVCSWEIPLLDKDDKVVPNKWQTVGFSKFIKNNGDWRVSVKKDGMPRIHVSAKVAEHLKAEFKDKRNLKVFE
jgi:hypothetical protein